MSRPQQIPVQLVAKFLFLWSHTQSHVATPHDTGSCSTPNVWRHEDADLTAPLTRNQPDMKMFLQVPLDCLTVGTKWVLMDAWHCITEEEGLSVPFSPCASCLWACHHSKLHIHWPLFCPLGRAWRGEQGGFGLRKHLFGFTSGTISAWVVAYHLW